MLESGYSTGEVERRAWLGVGGNKVGRLRGKIKDPTLRARKLEPKTPSHAFSNEDFERLKSDVGCWNPCLEDGFPCLHRCQRRYFIVKPNQPKIKWDTLHDEYKVKMEQGRHRVMSFTRWPQYVHYFFPEIYIRPPKEDVYDGYSEIFVWS